MESLTHSHSPYCYKCGMMPVDWNSKRKRWECPLHAGVKSALSWLWQDLKGRARDFGLCWGVRSMRAYYKEKGFIRW